MKPIKILNILISIYYYMIILGFGIKIIEPFMNLIFRDKANEFTFFGERIFLFQDEFIESIVVILMFALLVVVFVIALKNLKNGVNQLSKGYYFSDEVILSFKKAGFLFLISCAFSVAGRILLPLLLNRTFSFQFNTSIIAFLILGLLLLFLSEVFSEGMKLEKENNLTI